MQILADVSVYAFPEVVLVSSIPVFSIIVRYNILESGLMGKHWANVFSVLLPWIIAVPFYTGNITYFCYEGGFEWISHKSYIKFIQEVDSMKSSHGRGW